MKRIKNIVAYFLVFSMIFGNIGNILPVLAVNNITNGVIQLPTSEVRPYNIVTIGDSITFGASSNADGTSSNTQSANNYPKQLGDLLNSYVTANTTNIPSFNVANKGLNGETLLNTNDRNTYANRQEFTDICNNAHNTDAVIIKLGTNDSQVHFWVDRNGKTPQQNYIDSAVSMVNILRRRNPNIRIIFATSLKAMGRYNVGRPYEIQPDIVNNIIVPMQRELAIMNNWELIDINRLSKDWTASVYAQDNIHPNAESYHFIAEWMRDAINDDGTKSDTYKAIAVREFIEALPVASTIDSTNVATNVTLYNRAASTYAMLTTAQRSQISAANVTKLDDVKAKITTIMGEQSIVQVSSDPNTSTSANKIFANVGETVTLTVNKMPGHRFSKWTVSEGGVKLDDYTAETTTFVKGAAKVSIGTVHLKVNTPKPKTTIFNADDRVAFPSDTAYTEFEAEHLGQEYGTNTEANKVKVIADRSSSNDKAIDNFKVGNTLKLYYTAPAIGEYTVGITYRSNILFPWPAGNVPENGFNISGDNIDSKYVTLQPSLVNSSSSNIVYYEDFFTINVKTVGAGVIDIAASIGNGPTIDKFNIRKLDSYVINAVGDSITFGNVAEFTGTYTSYPHYLQQMLNSKIASGEITDKDNFIVDNCGVGSSCMMDNSDWPYKTKPGAKQTYLKSISNKADAVIVMLGTNDRSDANWVSKDGITPQASFENSCNSMLEAYKTSNPSIDIFIATSPYTSIRPNIKTDIVPLQRDIAAKNRYYLIDIAESTNNWALENFSSDKLHPNAKGHKLIATYMLDGLINKVEANNVGLSSLTASTTLSPTFEDTVLNYTAVTTRDSINITGVSKTATDTVTVKKGANTIATSTRTVTGTVPLVVGENVVKVIVTSAGLIKEYTITITKLDKTAFISDLVWEKNVAGYSGNDNGRDITCKENNANEPIKLNTATQGSPVAKDYVKGVGIHAGNNDTAGYIVVAIPDGFTNFKADVGVAFQRFTNNASNIKFKVFFGTTSDTFSSEAAYTSGVMTAQVPSTYEVVNLLIPSTAKFMKLKVDKGTSINSGHGNWADAKFVVDNAVTDIPSALVNVVTPVKGVLPSNATLTGTPNYAITSTKWKNGQIIHTAAFEKNTAYTVEIELSANALYRFSESTEIPIGYEKAIGANGSTMTLTHTFAKTACDDISDVAIQVVAPVKGAMPANATLTGTPNYSISSTVWKDGITPHTAMFATNKAYTIVVELSAKDGYNFTASTRIPQGYKILNNTGIGMILSCTFPETAYVSGDMDGNNAIELVDALIALKMETGITERKSQAGNFTPKMILEYIINNILIT